MEPLPHFFRERRDHNMMYGKSKPHIQVSMADLRLHRKVLFIACAVLLVAVIALGLLLLQGGYSQDKARDQLSQRMYSACSSALVLTKP